MQTQIHLCIGFILHDIRGGGYQNLPILVEKMTPSTPTPVLATFASNASFLNQSTKLSATVISQFIIDINSVIAQVIASIVSAILLGLAAWFTRKFWKPLISGWLHRSPLKSRRKRRELAAYLEQEREDILEALIPGSTDLRVKDIVKGSNLFIPPPWKDLYSTNQSTMLVAYLIEAISKGQRILLLGEPGQGKTTVLKRVFTIMVDHFLEKSANVFPIYIPLREFTFSEGDEIDLLWTHLHSRFPLPLEDFTYLLCNDELFFLFDGFDEIKGELTQHSINARASTNIFSHPAILSCRKNFYDLYLSMSTIQEIYPQKIELQPLTLSDPVTQSLTDSVTKYIMAFCNKKQDIAPQKIITPPEKIIESIQRNQRLQDLAQRPLLLVMILDIFTDPQAIEENEWSMAKLYQKYTDKWLQNEAAKPDSVLRQDQKAVLMREIAWSVYRDREPVPYGLYQRATFTRDDLSKILKCFPDFYQDQDIKFAQLLDDVCLRTFLIESEGVNYYFIHKSFQEYYVARYIYEAIRYREDDISYVTQALQELIPVEVSAFLKDMLRAKELSTYNKEQMASTLISVYQHNSTNNDQSALVRQNASYYLAVLNTEKSVEFLEHTYQAEPNKWVQRGMMVGLAINCDRADILDRYIDIVCTDPDAASINIGYHLVHYGDQALEEGYHDKGGESCAGTIRAIFRHLGSDRYRKAWVLDLLTLRMLLEKRGITILQTDKQFLPFLKAFLNGNHKLQGSRFQQEKKRLQEILGKDPFYEKHREISV